MRLARVQLWLTLRRRAVLMLLLGSGFLACSFLAGDNPWLVTTATALLAPALMAWLAFWLLFLRVLKARRERKAAGRNCKHVIVMASASGFECAACKVMLMAILGAQGREEGP